MLRFSLGVTGGDRIMDEYIRGTAHVRCFEEMVWTCTEEVKWIYRQWDDEVGTDKQEAQRKTKEERFMGVINEDMELCCRHQEDMKQQECER